MRDPEPEAPARDEAPTAKRGDARRSPRPLLQTGLAALVTGAILGTLGVLAVYPPGDPQDAIDVPPDRFLLPRSPERLLVGVGDRFEGTWLDGYAVLHHDAREKGTPVDLFQLWLPRDWLNSWIPKRALRNLLDNGTVPVVVHYYFDRGISKERVLAERDAWHASLKRMAHAIRVEGPVLVLLAPEFNDEPPQGETALVDWPGFGGELAEAVRIIRDRAPNALIGVCAGDFSPDRDLEASLLPVAHQLDFLAFQEMRAVTDPDRGMRNYERVGEAAVEYAQYLQRAFDKPILIGYIAVSTYGGDSGEDWEQIQSDALWNLVYYRQALLDAGVFGAIYFHYRDNLHHTGYFGEAEKHFGVVTADGRPKDSLSALSALAQPPDSDAPDSDAPDSDAPAG